MRQYLSLIQTILMDGSLTPQRATVNGRPLNMLVLPGLTFRHDVGRHGFPLLTTKRIPFNLVASELEFFIKGEHRKEGLHRRHNTIWDEWQAPGQDDPNELGPIYGVQWRKWEYITPNPPDWPEGGFETHHIDQLKRLLHALKTNPYDRRTVISAWNVADLDKMALPACHMIWQTVVTYGPNGEHVLNLTMTMRSADMMLGVPFNIASYALLLLLLAKHVGMRPGILHITMNNAHIYENHTAAAATQLTRKPRALPLVEIPDRPDGKPFDILDWDCSQVRLTGYDPEKTIRMEVAV